MIDKHDNELWPDKLGVTFDLGDGVETVLAAKHGQWWIPAVRFAALTDRCWGSSSIRSLCDEKDTINLIMEDAGGRRRELVMINLMAAISIASWRCIHVDQRKQVLLISEVLYYLAEPAPGPTPVIGQGKKRFLQRVFQKKKK
jgi:hypothetical protein